MIVNPISGGIDKSEFIVAVAHLATTENLHFILYNTTGADDVSKIKALYAFHKPERIIVAEDGLEVDLNGRRLICRDTPGHANHHNIIIDCKANVIFSGDIFGVAYPELMVNGAAFAFPATTPVNFDPQKMECSIDLIMSLKPDAVYLTHFGRQTELTRLAYDLKRMVRDYVQIALECVNADDVVAAINLCLQEYMLSEVSKFGIDLSPDKILGVIGMDMQINAQGLAVWLKSNVVNN